MGSKLVWGQSCQEVKVFQDKINGIKVGLRAKLSWSQSFWGQSKWDQSWFEIKVVMKSKFFRTKKMGSKLVWGQKKMGSKLSGQSFRGKVEYNQMKYCDKKSFTARAFFLWKMFDRVWLIPIKMEDTIFCSHKIVLSPKSFQSWPLFLWVLTFFCFY